MMKPGKKERPRRRNKRRKERDFDQTLIDVARVARVMKGGRRFGFRATVVIGDRKGKVAAGVAKGSDVTLAINKAVSKAKKNFIKVPIINDTIPHEITVKSGGARVFLKPAPQGTGIIAGGGIRAVAEMAGIKNLLSKMQGSASKVNNVRATLKAFEQMKTPKDVAAMRGKDLAEMMPKKKAKAVVKKTKIVNEKKASKTEKKA